ncbi:MAG: CHASE2 domain-containing protein [Desulfobulbaceae bacterium]|nr:CHASE2 domain-containing protein [Desulfobulbaceae bacterium]
MKKIPLIIPNWLLGLFLALIIVLALAWSSSPLNKAELKICDTLSRLRQRDTPSPVVIVEIDSRSIRELGPWPWPRSYMAEAIRKISAANAKAIGLHVMYPIEEINPALKQIRNIRKISRVDASYKRIDDLLQETEQAIDADSYLITAVKAGKNIVTPLTFEWAEPPAAATNLPTWLDKSALTLDTPPPTALQFLADLRNPFLVLNTSPRPLDIYPSFTGLGTAATRSGHLDYSLDPDGLLRRQKLLIPYQGHFLPSLSLQMAMAYNEKNFSDLSLINNHNLPKAVQFEGKRIPVDLNCAMLIDFDANPAVITRYSFSDVSKDRISSGVLDGKLVLIGVTDPDLIRNFRTPLGQDMTPVEVSANCLENIINSSYLQRPGWVWFLEFAALIYFGALLFYLSSKLSARLGLLILSSFLLTWYGLALFMFMNNGLWLYVLPQTLTVVVGFSLQQVNRMLAAPRKKKDEQTELNKMLGLSFQGQGMLDMAFDSFRKCSLADPSVKESLYNLGLDFERKRMFNKAVSVYEYLLKEGAFKDANDRRWRIRRAESKNSGNATVDGKNENTVLFGNETKTLPTLGRYEVIKEIGKGAIGTVYLGRDPKINRKVAIKTLRYDEVDSEQLKEIKERFFREAEAAGRLSHPNIVTIFDVGEDYDITYMAMEYLDGHDLSGHCRKENLLPAKVVLNIIIRVAFALDYAHKHNVVHRDIKPANIMLTEKGHVKVTDFGIARLTGGDSTQTGVILGTPNYMSPEQVLGKKLDGRSDIFSLGAVFYELLTGDKPFKSNNIGNLMHNIASAKFRPIKEAKPDVPDCCAELVTKMMAKSRSLRFSSAGEIVISAQQCLEKVQG